MRIPVTVVEALASAAISKGLRGRRSATVPA